MKEKRMISVILSLTMMVSYLVACTPSNKNISEEVEDLSSVIAVNPQITQPEEVEDVIKTESLGQFYNLESYQINESDSSLFFYDYKYCMYDNNLFYTQTIYQTSDEGDDTSYCNISYYDLATGKSDTSALYQFDQFMYMDVYPVTFNGDLYVFAEVYSMVDEYNCYEIDFELDDNGKFSSVTFSSVSMNGDCNHIGIDQETGKICINPETEFDAVYQCGDGLLIICHNNEDYYIGYLSPDGIANFQAGYDSVFAFDFICKLNNKILLRNYTDFCEYDVNDFSILPTEDSDYTYLYDSKVNQISGENGVYINSLEGFYYLNQTNDKATNIVDYNCVIGDVSKLASADYLMEKDGNYYFLGFECDYESLKNHLVIYKLVPTDNPYADKTVLRMACTSLDEGIVSTIHNFNALDNEYFIEYRLINGSVPNQYAGFKRTGNDTYYYGGDATAYYEYTKYMAQLESLEYSIIQEGSFDLLYGFGSYELFNTERVCLNLNNYKDEWNNSSLYENILDIRTDSSGHLYQIPLNFDIDAISTAPIYYDYESEPSDVIPEKVYVTKLTLDDYKELSEMYDGSDPLHEYVSDYECLIELIGNDFSSLINVDAKMTDFSVKGFNDVFEYAMKDITEWRSTPIDEAEESESFVVELETDFADDYDQEKLEYVEILSVLDFAPYFYNTLAYNSYSIPSIVGHNLTARLENSIGVYKDTKYDDACMQFVAYLLGNEVDTSNQMFSFSINRNMNHDIQSEMLDLIASDAEVIDYRNYKDELFNNVDDMIGQIDSFRGDDSILEIVILQSLIDYSRHGSTVTTSEAINTIEQSVQSVLDRY